MNCIACYCKITSIIDGEKIETCHKCLIKNYELCQLDKLHNILESYEFNNGWCENCLSNCSTTLVYLCYEHMN
jgi:hypothetical protein